MTTTDKAETIRVGDVIMPPERELRLWMRKHIEFNNLPESWAHLNVASVYKGNDSKGGAWIHVGTHYATSGRKFNFKARPATPWAIVERKAVALQG